MRGENVFADELVRGGPPLVEFGVVAFVADGGDVVEQRVEPDVGDELLVERQLDAPREARFRPRDAEVLQLFGFEEAEGFVGAEVGLDELRMGFDVVDEPLLIFAHAEEVVGLDDSVDFAPALRAVAVDEVFFGEEALAADAVPAFVFCAVDFVAVVEILQHFLNDDFVTLFGGADEIVVGDFETLPQLLEADNGLVALLLRRQSVFIGGLLDLLAVFVGAGQEPGRGAEKAVIAGEHVGQNGGVRVADVRLVVHIIDRCRYVVAFLSHGAFPAG